METKKSIEALQFFVTHLAEGAIVHKQQGMIFKSQGFTKLGQKYIGHFDEEMGWVEKFTERILDLGGEIKRLEKALCLCNFAFCFSNAETRRCRVFSLHLHVFVFNDTCHLLRNLVLRYF